MSTTKSMKPASKDDATKDEIILNPGNLVQELESRLRMGRDMKSILNQLGGNLNISFNAAGRIVNVWATNTKGDTVANESHISALGGVRRQVLDKVKESEKLVADTAKISIIEKAVARRSTTLQRLKPDSNGRIAEIARSALNLAENIEIMEMWTDGPLKSYLEEVAKEVGQVLADEAVHLIHGGKKENQDRLSRLLKEAKMPEWYFMKLTQKGGVKPEVMEAMDFLYPKNFQSGISLTNAEIADSDLLEKHRLVTIGNENLFHVAVEFQNEVTAPGGRDAIRQVLETLAKIKWTLVPTLTIEEAYSKYKDTKMKLVEVDVPDGEAGTVLREPLRRMAEFDMWWSTFHRFLLFQPTDKNQFWKYIVARPALDKWFLTSHQNVKFWVSELEDADVTNDHEFSGRALEYCIAKMGIYDEGERDRLLKVLAFREYFTCEERSVLQKEQLDNIRATVKQYHIEMDKVRKMPYVTDEEKADKDQAIDNIGSMPTVDDFDDIPKWGDSTHGFVLKPVVFVGKHGDYESILHMDLRNEPTVAPATKEKYSVLIRGAKKPLSKDKGVIGVAAGLTDKTLAILAKIAVNEFGREFTPKISSWLKISFTGSNECMNIASEAIYESLNSKDFLEEEV